MPIGHSHQKMFSGGDLTISNPIPSPPNQQTKPVNLFPTSIIPYHPNEDNFS